MRRERGSSIQRRVLYQPTPFDDPTELAELEAEEQELEPHTLSGGWGLYKANPKKPGWLSDTLDDKECYVVIDGAVFTGEIAVWRCPCQAAGDLEIWTVKELPESYGPVPDHSLLVSPAGLANSGMAGGDFDGNLSLGL